MTEVPANTVATTPIQPIRGRFAPSPSGDLHFGSLVAALGSWLRARTQGGTWIVRIEDIDRARRIDGAVDRIISTLSAFGLESDEPVVMQSDRSALYASALEKLKASDSVYRCHCTRNDLAIVKGIHPDQCVSIRRCSAPAWRLRVDDMPVQCCDAIFGTFEQRLDREVGDFLVCRADGTFTYQLAVVVDDADQHISEIVRGADLLDSTPRQIHLQRRLGLSTPGYLHLPLALDSDGRKLSKQDRDRPVDGADPLPAIHEALRFLGQPIPTVRRVERLLQVAADQFDIHRIAQTRPEHAAMQKD